ncbi:type II toxin-antitoxin system RelE/ParE family toxin [bacterium]|nr:type II toxin-antitoxin system RelE/ParE family toxin [candidate division CSSED10-310 bacterium]
MNREVIIRAEAEKDISEAFQWYEEKMRGLGHRFLMQVDAAIRLIKKFPECAPVEYRNTRKLLLRRFPYKLIYLVEGSNIIVIGVIHMKLHPEYTKKRQNAS